MSGYNPHTGWTQLTPTQFRRYFRELPGDIESGSAEEIVVDRLKRAGLEGHFCIGLHARCGPGRLWTLLSGRPADREEPTQPEGSPPPGCNPYWLDRWPNKPRKRGGS